MNQTKKHRRSITFDTTDPRALTALFRATPHMTNGRLYTPGGAFEAVLSARDNASLQTAGQLFGQACGDNVRPFRREENHVRFSTPAVELGLILKPNGVWTVVLHNYETPAVARQLLERLVPLLGNEHVVRYPINASGPLTEITLGKALARIA